MQHVLSDVAGWPHAPGILRSPVGAVSNDGVLAQLVVLSASGVVRIPDYLSYEEASTLPCAGVTAWCALIETPVRPKPGATVLVLGTGGVSVVAAQLALAEGLRVIATTSSHDKAARLRELGVSEVINYREQSEWHEEVLRRTGGEGVDHVIEVGGAGTLPRSLQAVRFGGTVSLIGLLTGVGAQIDPMPILFRASRVEGILVGSVHAFETMNRGLQARELRPVIDEVFPLERAPQALATMKAARHFGKIVIRIS